jgi:MFS family permease
MRKDFPTVSEQSFTFFNAICSLTAIIGPLLINLLFSPALRLGRRISLFGGAVVAVILWLLHLLTTAESFWLAILLRGLLGITIGTFTALTPMYVVELSPPALVGFFGSFSHLFVSLGITICYLFGTWLPWRQVVIVAAAINGLHAGLLWLVPDSPVPANPPSNGERVCSTKWIGRVMMACLFTGLQQLTGINTIVSRLNDLFTAAGVSIDSGYASVIASTAQLPAGMLAPSVITKFGQRPIWILSFAVVMLTHVLYAIAISPLQEKHHMFPNWVPIAIIFANQFAYSLGAGPIPWFVVPDMFPDFIRATAMSLATSSCWLFSFFSLEIEPPITSGVGQWGTFLYFAGMSCISVFFGILAMKKQPVVDPVDRDRYDGLVDESSAIAEGVSGSGSVR